MEKAKKKKGKVIVLSIVGVFILCLAALIIWASWGKNLGEQVAHTSFLVTDEADATKKNASVVYMTTDISSEGMMAIYKVLGVEATGNVAVKLSTGEAGDTYYLSPDLIGDLVKSVNGTIVECNTAYGGSRANTASHLQVAADHGDPYPI